MFLCCVCFSFFLSFLLSREREREKREETRESTVCVDVCVDSQSVSHSVNRDWDAFEARVETRRRRMIQRRWRRTTTRSTRSQSRCSDVGIFSPPVLLPKDTHGCNTMNRCSGVVGLDFQRFGVSAMYSCLYTVLWVWNALDDRCCGMLLLRVHACTFFRCCCCVCLTRRFLLITQ